MKKLLILLTLIGCGGSATVSNTATSNVNIDSQNGDTQCSYRCEPVQFEGGIGYLVTQDCDGNTNGPEFMPSCPSASLAAVEEAPVSFEEPEESSDGGLSQEVL